MSALNPSGERIKLSVVVLNWNGRHHLEICLPALQAQTRPADEVIVVDNCSTRDDSVAYIRAHYPEVRIVQLSENRGFAGGNNAGLELAAGDIVLLNNDTRPEPDWLEQLERCAIKHPEAGVIACHLTDWSGERTDSAGDGCRVTGRGYARNRGGPISTAPESGPVFGACAGAALYRRALIGKIGFLDSDFFMNFEDTDLAVRAQLHAWPAWFCREAIVRHRVSASQGSWSDLNVYYGARNHLWVCAKNIPASLLLKWAPVTLAEMAALFLAAMRRGKALPYIRGVLAGIKGLGGMLPKRRKILTGRRVSVRDFEQKLHRPQLSHAMWRRALRQLT